MAAFKLIRGGLAVEPNEKPSGVVLAADAVEPTTPAPDSKRHLQVVPETRDQHRSRRKHEVRPRTISMQRLTKRELEHGRMLYPDVEGVVRPKTRGDCLPGGVNEERPCPFAACIHHLHIDVSPKTGSLKLTFPDVALEDATGETCALDVAENFVRGAGIGDIQRLERVGEFMNMTRERVRQIKESALRKLNQGAAAKFRGDVDRELLRGLLIDDDADEGDEGDDDTGTGTT